jgi:hypothetical protein
MMKKVLIFSIFLVLLTTSAQAQRYLPKMRGIEAIGGMVDLHGFYLHGGYAQYTRNKNRWAVAGEYLQRNYGMEGQSIPLMQVTVEGGFFVKFFSDQTKTFFCAAGLSLLTGYEMVNLNQKLLPNGAVITNGDAWLYGAAVALELEYYLDDRYVLLFTAKERLTGGSSVRMFHAQLGLGLKYILE